MTENNLVGVITDVARGGTFLSWSLHFLSGVESYYSYMADEMKTVTDNPLTSRNAHNFRTNHIDNVDNVKLFFEKNPTDKFNTIYMHQLVENTEQAIKLISNQVTKIILVTNKKEHWLYEVSYSPRNPNPITSNGAAATNDHEWFNDFLATYFKNSITTYGLSQSSPKWELREFLSLTLTWTDTYNKPSILTYVDKSIDHYPIDFFDLITNLDLKLEELFDYLQIPLKYELIPAWKEVYTEWKKIHKTRYEFVMYFDMIIDYIISGRNMDLLRFNFDLMQEALIQQTLLRDYGYSIRSHGLEKFSNTRQIYELLEKHGREIKN